MSNVFAVTYGANPSIISDYIELSYTKVKNAVGLAVITVDISHPAVTGLALDDEVEIWRGELDPSWDMTPYIDFRGLYRGAIRRHLPDGSDVVDLTLQHEMCLLQRPINAFKSGVDSSTLNGYSVWNATPIDDIMEDLVDFNFAGHTTYRITAASSKNVQGATSGSFASPIDFTAPYRNVLAALQELADYEDIVFNVTKASSASAAWTFTAYPLTIGTDRSATVIFEPSRENIAEVTLNEQRLQPTTTIAAGQGEGINRATVVYKTADFNAGTNQIEQFLDARHLDSTDKLTDFATAVGEQDKYRPQIRFTPLQTPALHYGQHYFWGDIVTVRYNDNDYTQRVSEVTVRVNAREETIQIQTESVG